MPRSPQRYASLTIVLMFGLPACSGAVGGGSGNEDNAAGSHGSAQAGTSGTASGGAAALPPYQKDDPGDPNAAGARPLNRLTRSEYDRTVRDLLGVKTSLTNNFAKEALGASGYATTGPVGTPEAGRYQDAAESAAADAVKRLADIAPCAAGKAEAACAKDFVTAFGRRAFRRPLQPDEQDAFAKLYETMRAAPINYDHANGVRVVISAMLQSPQFLYHWERPAKAVDAKSGLAQLDGHEVASRLSYLLWGTMPDATLFAAADANKLGTEAEVVAQAERLLSDNKAADGVLEFFRQWLDIEQLDELTKDTKAFPGWNDNLKPAIAAETEAFLRQAVLTDGKLSTLLTSRETFVNGALAPLYGVDVKGNTVTSTQLRSERSGLFTRAGFLAIQAKPYQTSPVKRGVVVLNRLLCTPVPPPPPDVDNTPPPVDATKQTREQYAMHSAAPACRGCHQLLDPYGFAFEQFDGMGKFRDMEAGRPIDASGTVTLDGKEQSFKDASELMAIFAKSAEVHQCMATQWLRFATGRMETVADQHSRYEMVQGFSGTDANFHDLLLALVKTKSFRFRTTSPSEVQP